MSSSLSSSVSRKRKRTSTSLSRKRSKTNHRPKRPTQEEIRNATEQYVILLNKMDLSESIKVVAEEHQKQDVVHVIPFFGMINTPTDFNELRPQLKTKVMKQLVSDLNHNTCWEGYSQEEFQGTVRAWMDAVSHSKDKICQMGIVSVPLEAEEEDGEEEKKLNPIGHFVSFVKFQTNVYVWDSASNGDDTQTEIFYFLRELYPSCTLHSIRTDPQMFQPGGGDSSEGTIVEQNIFCHTWTLWFLCSMLCLTNDKMTDIEKAVEKIGNITFVSVRKNAQIANLVHIKRFAWFIIQNWMPLIVSQYNKKEQLVLNRHLDYVRTFFPWIWMDEQGSMIESIFDKKFMSSIYGKQDPEQGYLYRGYYSFGCHWELM